ncbi:glutamine synthetase [Motilibacter rhizosphaerae]|uniref:Glutamine synthetase n=1 Tax=Motilibacter rhizosphaerae TaxID=598652 RepID=A0A4Q7NUH6_9ACTN|nr:type III glutamate--ammonia ligase [Motilibacter rhizosphaerae]RZS90866.1 glutamine synthetase [Motilibacter rhizosphaerae]
MTTSAVPESRTTDPASSDVAAVVAELYSRKIRYAMVSFVDVHGKSKSKVVPVGHLADAVGGSELFTGAALDGVPQEVSDEEVAAVPDLSRWFVLPSRPDVAWFPSTLHYKGGVFDACSRGILQRATAAAAELGYTFNLGVETEFYLLRRKDDGTLAPLADADDLAKPCYDSRSLLRTFGIVDELVTAMDEAGFGVYSFDHEDGNGQFETDFGYADAVTTADRLTYFRLMLSEMAHQHGAIATFMPKPFADQTGSAGHMNMSLADAAGSNLFATDDDPRGLGLSELGYQFIAGVLKHAPAICAVVAPTVNSYKRLIRRSNNSGFTWAPIFGCYGGNNRTNMLRIPLAGGRVECRAADSANNPYLAAALMLAAGLEGIRAAADPGAPNVENMYLLGEDELAARGISHLPTSLGDALDAFEADPLTREVFGADMHAAFLEVKRAEVDAYNAHVSQWETERYLEFF